MRRLALFVSIAALVLGVLPLGAAQAAGPPDHAPVAGSYIVVLNAGEPGSVANEHSRRHNASVKHVYRHALRGYAATMSERAAGNIARDPRVAYVEQDGVVTASTTTQSNATWGLDRIDQLTSQLDGKYSYDRDGAGVAAYIIDTGIKASHNDFGGRVVGGAYAINDGRGTDDCNGHGTHVAGTVGGSTWGVAKGVTLVPVRVLDCNGSGTWSGVIAGLDWVTANAAKPAVANMSLGGGANASVDAAVERTIASGVSVVVAAGNGNRGGKEQDACGYSPARVAEAITIGATTDTDAKTSWSNYGSCVDFFAPGAGITSAWYDSDSATRTISGTSMAAPHVAGAAALYLQANATDSALQVRDALYANTTKGIVTSSNTANNDLLYTGTEPDGVIEEPPPNTEPTASFTYSCTDLACTFSDASSDSDGSVVAWSWTFGDGGTSAEQNPPSHTYAAAGDYTVTLTVTDDEGAPASTSQSVTVSAPSDPEPPAADIMLSASGYKVKGVQHADLGWSGTTATQVDVYRNGVKIDTTANDGAYTDNIGVKGGGMSYTYKVCEAGTTNCAQATVTF